MAGIALTAIYAPNGWIGRYLEPLGIKVAFTPLGVMVALTFIGLPFVVRTVQPVLEELDAEVEEAAASLGANRWQTFRRVIFPMLLPALLTGFALAFARAVGEYGSVVFIAGNMPMETEITPLLIITKLEQYDYAGRHGHRRGDAGRPRFCMLLVDQPAAEVEQALCADHERRVERNGRNRANIADFTASQQRSDHRTSHSEPAVGPLAV